MSDKKVHYIRTKIHEQAKLVAGKGVSQSVSKSIRRKPVPDFGSERRFSRGRSVTSVATTAGKASVLTKLSALLDLEEYEFPDETEEVVENLEGKLDVTALDRYNEDIRRIRKMTIDECRLLPHKGDVDDYKGNKIKLIIRCLCRTAYYGTHKAQVLSEGSVVLIVWVLNRRNLNAALKTHILQSFSEMFWTSVELKTSLFKSRGMRVIAKLLVNGLNRRSELARWACYALATACVGCAEIIKSVSEIDQFDEAVGEIAFNAYWTNWPANFGSILQGILYGPHSVVPIEDTCEFI